MSDVLDSIIDAGLAAGDGEPAAPATESTATPEAAQPAPAPAAQDTTEPEGDDDSRFGEHAAYIKQLRQESAKYRTERNELVEQYGKRFEGLAPEDANLFLEVVEAYKTDPAAAARWMEENAQALRARLGPDAAAAVQQQADADKPLTRAEVERIMAEREQAAQQQAAVAAVNKQVTDLGIDPASYAGKALMLRAIEDHKGDIAAAHAAMQAERDALAKEAVAAFLADKERTADTTAGVVPQAGASGQAERKAKSAKEAGEMFREYLEAG